MSESGWTVTFVNAAALDEVTAMPVDMRDSL